MDAFSFANHYSFSTSTSAISFQPAGGEQRRVFPANSQPRFAPLPVNTAKQGEKSGSILVCLVL